MHCTGKAQQRHFIQYNCIKLKKALKINANLNNNKDYLNDEETVLIMWNGHPFLNFKESVVKKSKCIVNCTNVYKLPIQNTYAIYFRHLQ